MRRVGAQRHGTSPCEEKLNSGIFQDFAANRGRPHMQLVLVLFRASQTLRNSRAPIVRIVFGVPVSAIYRLIALTGFGVDIPTSTKIGPGFAVHHGMGLVIHNDSIVGSSVTMRHCTTLGSKRGLGAPVIEDNVNIGPNTCVIGPVRIGQGATIGAGSVVVHDVKDYATSAGNPAKEIGTSSATARC